MTKRSKTRGYNSGLGTMVSAMIPGAKMTRNGRIVVNVATSHDTLIFNIGGVIFETYRSTLYRVPNSPLANEQFLKDHYRAEKNDYFFDRDPDIFRATLNYLRTGELHIPSYICGPAAKLEFDFWGVKPSLIESCCWTNYNDWNTTLESLKQLEYDRRGSEISVNDNLNRNNRNWWKTTQLKIWHIFGVFKPSLGSKIYGFISLFFVMLSIFSFVASTTVVFKETATVQPSHNANNYFNNDNKLTTAIHEPTGYAYNDQKVVNIIGFTQSIFNESDVSTESTTVIPATNRFENITQNVLSIIDFVCLAFFTTEFIIRLICTPMYVKYLRSVMGCIDLVALLPDYIEMIVYAARPDIINDSSIVNFISVFRIIRIFRIFRLMKHVPGLWILLYTLKASGGELVLLACFMFVGILIFSSLIYFAEEHDNFESIPHAFWWAIVTMTTVGYGDMCPKTTLGKLIGSLCAMSGLLMIGFSVPALVNNFMLYYKHVLYGMKAEREKTKYDKGINVVNYTNTESVKIDIDGDNNKIDTRDSENQELIKIKN